MRSRPTTLPLAALAALALLPALAGAAAAQTEPSWKDRAVRPVPKDDATAKEREQRAREDAHDREAHERDVHGRPAPRAPTPTASRGEPGAFDKLVDFFLATEGGPKRSWGVVPLVVADSNAGFGGGIQFVHQDLFERSIGAEVFAIYTSNTFSEVQLRLSGPPVFSFDWRSYTRYRNRPRLFFFGIGNETDEDGKLSLGVEDTLVEVQLGYAITPQIFLFAIGEFSNVNAGDGEHDPDEEAPVSSQFSSQTLTGFRDDGLTNGVGAAFVMDFRDDAIDPTRGARLELRAMYHGPEIGSSPYRYGSYVADTAIYIPIFPPWRLVLAAGARFEAVDASTNSVPFYELPSLGGGRSLRGFLEGRFRDRNSLLFQGELRFPIWRMVRGAFFVDAGRVYSDFKDPPSPFFKNLHVDAGVGIRLVIQPDIFTRLDFALSEEEFTFALEFGHAF